MKSACAVLFLVALLCPDARALEPSAGITVTTLARDRTHWDGKPIVYPQGEAEVTALLIEVAPGAETGWHAHPVSSFAYLIEGELEVTLDDGRVKRLAAGDVLSEVVDRPHNGRNTGAKPLRLVVFYTGAAGVPLTVKRPAPAH